MATRTTFTSRADVIGGTGVQLTYRSGPSVSHNAKTGYGQNVAAAERLRRPVGNVPAVPSVTVGTALDVYSKSNGNVYIWGSPIVEIIFHYVSTRTTT